MLVIIMIIILVISIIFTKTYVQLDQTQTGKTSSIFTEHNCLFTLKVAISIRWHIIIVNLTSCKKCSPYGC